MVELGKVAGQAVEVVCMHIMVGIDGEHILPTEDKLIYAQSAAHKHAAKLTCIKVLDVDSCEGI